MNNPTAGIENLRKNPIKGTQGVAKQFSKIISSINRQFQKCYISPISPSCCYPSVCDGNVRSRGTRHPFLCCCFLSCIQPLTNKSQSRKSSHSAVQVELCQGWNTCTARTNSRIKTHHLSAAKLPQRHHKYLCSWIVRAAVYLWEV